MTLKIQTKAELKSTIFALTGRIQSEQLPELQSLLESELPDQEVVLDLKELRLIDREAVCFLANCEARGVKLRNCPAYIRAWILQEEIGSRQTANEEQIEP
jgi:ABC-type transporter Mla MlaB component